MPASSARPGRSRLWMLTAVLFFLFGGLTAYQIVARDRERAEAERTAAGPVALPSEVAAPAEGDWPQWRGPKRDGVSTETGLLAAWPEGGPRKLWEQPSGAGFSSIAVARGRAFTLVQDGASEALVCWNAVTGAELWRFRYPTQYTNLFGNGPRATPTIADEHIYSIGATGKMYCLKAFADQPDVVWGPLDLLQEFHASVPEWGVAGSPLVEGDHVYVQPGGPSGNSVAALHKDTGAVVWRRHDYPAGYCSPMAGTFAGRRQIVFFAGTHLIGVAPDAGNLLWEYAWPTNQQCNIATPIVTQDYVFITSGYGMGCALLQIEPAGKGWRARPIYRNTRLRGQHTSPVLYQGHVYGFDDTTLVCLDFASGKVRWKERGFDQGSLLVADGKLILYGANGLLALAAADPDGYHEHGRFPASHQTASCWSVPALADGRLYVRDQEKVACYDLKRREP